MGSYGKKRAAQIKDFNEKVEEFKTAVAKLQNEYGLKIHPGGYDAEGFWISNGKDMFSEDFDKFGD